MNQNNIDFKYTELNMIARKLYECLYSLNASENDINDIEAIIQDLLNKEALNNE
jgi:hypothetical protein